MWKTDGMPESPEVQALVEELGSQLAGRAITDVDVIEFRVVKTRARPPSALVGERVTGAMRHGKHVDLVLGPQHLVVSLGRHGWARWQNGDGDDPVGYDAPVTGAADADADAAPAPALVTIDFDDGRTLEFTDAGGWVSLGFSVVDDPAEVPAVAKLGPDPADPGFSRADFDRAVVGRRKQIKAVLQEQESLAGIGNAYSDEILHTAKISPVAHAAALTERRARSALRRDGGHHQVGDRRAPRHPDRSAQGGEGRGHAGARQGGGDVPGLRRHDPRLLVREHDGAVLPDVPDERRGASAPGVTGRASPSSRAIEQYRRSTAASA